MADDKNEGMLAPRVSPTVSKDKLTQVALKKLSRGWVIIIGDKRKNSNFFKPGSGFDPLPISVALKLVSSGLLKEEGRHALGTRYVLSAKAEALPEVTPAPTPVVDEDDEEDDDEYGELDDIDDIDEDFEEEEEEADKNEERPD